MTDNIAQGVEGVMSAVPGYFTMVIRVLLVGLALAVVLRCAFSLLRERTVGETWCWLSLPGGGAPACEPLGEPYRQGGFE